MELVQDTVQRPRYTERQQMYLCRQRQTQHLYRQSLQACLSWYGRFILSRFLWPLLPASVDLPDFFPFGISSTTHTFHFYPVIYLLPPYWCGKHCAIHTFCLGIQAKSQQPSAAERRSRGLFFSWQAGKPKTAYSSKLFPPSCAIRKIFLYFLGVIFICAKNTRLK